VTSVEPALVWMVHRETPASGVRGQLALEPGHVVFRPDVGPSSRVDSLGQTIIALSEIGKASKSRGSPVLEVHTTTPGLPSVVLFYFAEPPKTHLAMNPRAHAAGVLGASNAFMGEDAAAWAKAIRRAKDAPSTA
jgi:hypothetical protein